MDKDGLSSMILKLRNILDFFPTKCLMSKHQVIIMSPGFHSLYMPLSQWSNVKFICNIQSLSIFPPTLHYLSFSQHCAKLQNESFYLSTFLLLSLMSTLSLSCLLTSLSLSTLSLHLPHTFISSQTVSSLIFCYWTLSFSNKHGCANSQQNRRLTDQQSKLLIHSQTDWSSAILINPKSDWLTTVRLTEPQLCWQNHSQADRTMVRLTEPQSGWQNYGQTDRTAVRLTEPQSGWQNRS